MTQTFREGDQVAVQGALPREEAKVVRVFGDFADLPPTRAIVQYASGRRGVRSLSELKPLHPVTPAEENTPRVTTVDSENGPFKLAFPQMKPGMRVQEVNLHGQTMHGRILGKINASKELLVLFDGNTQPLTVPAGAVSVLPADPLDQIHPMLAKNLDDYKSLSLDQLLQDDSWGAEEKYDGERTILAVNLTGQSFRATTRVVGKNTGTLGENTARLPHLKGLFPVPEEGTTVFDGELMHENGFQALRSIMGSDPALAVEKQRDLGFVGVRLFDILWFGGNDLRGMEFKQRRVVLETWFRESWTWLQANYPMTHALFAEHVSLSPLKWTADEKQHLLETVLDAGGEGIMLKHARGRYTDTTVSGQRSADLLKVKPFAETDVIVVGFEEGKGQFNTDKYGAIHVAQWVPRDRVTAEMAKNEYVAANGFGLHNNVSALYDDASRSGLFRTHMLVYMGTTGGFTQEQEQAFRAAPGDFIGKAMEVSYQENGRWPKTGRLRHSHFVRMRDDKSTDDCTYEPNTA